MLGSTSTQTGLQAADIFLGNLQLTLVGKKIYYRRMESIIDSPYPQIDLLYMYPPPYILLYTYGNTIDVFGDVAFWYLHTKTFDSLSKRNTRNICDTKNDTKKTFLVRNSRTA